MSDHLSIELEQAKATIERQEENVAKLKEESASLKEALSRCEAELSDRAKSISSLEGKLKVETERANDLDAKLKISEETHQKMASEYSSSSTRAKGESEKDLEEHRSLVATLESALEEREQSMIEARSDLSETRAELNEARNGAACFEEIKSGLEQQIGKLRSDIERQQAEWESTENRLRDVILSKDAQMSSINEKPQTTQRSRRQTDRPPPRKRREVPNRCRSKPSSVPQEDEPLIAMEKAAAVTRSERSTHVSIPSIASDVGEFDCEAGYPKEDQTRAYLSIMKKQKLQSDKSPVPAPTYVGKQSVSVRWKRILVRFVYGDGLFRLIKNTFSKKKKKKK
eukprot:267071_1